MEGPESPDHSYDDRLNATSQRQQIADIGSQGDLQKQSGLTPVELAENQKGTNDAPTYNFGRESPEMDLPNFEDDPEADPEDPYKRIYTPALPKSDETIEDLRYELHEDAGEEEDFKDEGQDSNLVTEATSEDAGEASPRKKKKKKKKKKTKKQTDEEGPGAEGAEMVMLQHADSSGNLSVRLPPIGQTADTLQEEDTIDLYRESYDATSVPNEGHVEYEDKSKMLPPSALYPVLGSQGYPQEVEGSQEPGQSSEIRQRSWAVQESEGQGGAENLHHHVQHKEHSFIIGAEDSDAGGIGCCGWVLYFFSIILIIITLPFSLMFTIKVVQEYERAVIFRLGRLPSGGAKGPGIFFIIPCIENYTKIDLRTVTFDVPPQEVLTKDSVTVSVDAVVYYQVSNPTVSVANVENAHHSTRLLAQTTLRNILGTKDMAQILSDREGISNGMQSTLDDATDRWGIKVERVEIKDVRLPVQLQRAMAAEAEAAREARAKVIAAEGEYNASRALKDAATIMDSSPSALQLRYLQTLNSISAEKNSTIIFPVPIDLLSKKKS